MAMWKLNDTKGLDATALACAAAGAVVGATATLVAPAAGWFAAVGPMALGIAAPRAWRHRIALGVLGLAAWVPIVAWADRPEFSRVVAGAVAGLVLVIAERWRRRAGGFDRSNRWAEAATVAIVALVWPVAAAALGSAQASTLAHDVLPPGVVRAVVGACAGLLAALGSLPLFVARQGDRVLEALAAMRPSIDADLRSLLRDLVDARARTLKLLAASSADARTRQETERGLDGLALASIELAHRFSSVDHVLSRLSPDSVAQRAEALRAQLGDATDAGVRRDLERAITALEEQKLQLERLRQGRQRLLARLESELASLEKTEMSLALLASGDAAIAGVRLEAIGAGLGRQAAELSAEGQALQETLVGPPGEALRRIVHA